MKPLLGLLSITGLVSAGDKWIFNYAKLGYDWPTDAIPPDDYTGVNHCGEPNNQSPINLMEPLGSYGWAYGYPQAPELDKIFKHYMNPVRGSEVVWSKLNLILSVSKIDPDEPSQESYFISQLAQDLHGAPTNRLRPTSFHFHSPSEHTKDGKRVDLELHVGHAWDIDSNPTTLQKSLVAVWFSVEGYDQDISNEEVSVINEFFESLNLDENYEQIDGMGLGRVPFKEAMNTFDFADRYMYIGSGTRPPCSKYVQRNVVRRVYPIEYKYVFFIKERFKRHEAELGAPYNIRGISPVDGQQIYYIGGRSLVAAWAATAGLILSIV